LDARDVPSRTGRLARLHDRGAEPPLGPCPSSVRGGGEPAARSMTAGPATGAPCWSGALPPSTPRPSAPRRRQQRHVAPSSPRPRATAACGAALAARGGAAPFKTGPCCVVLAVLA